jgi:hypothetical protein
MLHALLRKRRSGRVHGSTRLTGAIHTDRDCRVHGLPTPDCGCPWGTRTYCACGFLMYNRTNISYRTSAVVPRTHLAPAPRRGAGAGAHHADRGTPVSYGTTAGTCPGSRPICWSLGSQWRLPADSDTVDCCTFVRMAAASVGASASSDDYTASGGNASRASSSAGHGITTIRAGAPAGVRMRGSSWRGADGD